AGPADPLSPRANPHSARKHAGTVPAHSAQSFPFQSLPLGRVLLQGVENSHGRAKSVQRGSVAPPARQKTLSPSQRTALLRRTLSRPLTPSPSTWLPLTNQNENKKPGSR